MGGGCPCIYTYDIHIMNMNVYASPLKSLCFCGFFTRFHVRASGSAVVALLSGVPRSHTRNPTMNSRIHKKRIHVKAGKCY